MEYTTNYNLKKPSTTTNVRITDLNENTDVIDTKLKELENGLQNIDFSTIENELNTKVSTTDFNAHKGEITQQIGTETLTTTSKTLKGAINEVKQSANDIKTKWASVVGSPLLATDTQAQLQTKTQTIKNTLATNLTAKGQSSVGTETLTALANKVANVNIGKKWASGTLSNFTADNTHVQSVRGLAFKPKYILTEFWYVNGWSQSIYVFISNKGLYMQLGASNAFITPQTVYDDGFDVICQTRFADIRTITWIAIE